LKKTYIRLLTIAFLLTPITVSAQQKLPVVYVAVGDSLAAGQTPNREIDFGYSDLIAQELSRHLPVAAFTKSLSFPGYTTNDVLQMVRNADSEEALKHATLITISAGANDLLRVIRNNPMAGTLSYQQIQADSSLNTVRLNMKEILKELNKRAPEAEVYIMGYYFPYQFVLESQKSGTAAELEQLNTILRKEAEEAGVHFVDVASKFGKDAKSVIPNPADVHPNLEGYRLMANSFFEVMANGRMAISPSEMPKPSPKTFEELSAQLKQQADDKTAALTRFPPNLYVVAGELHQTQKPGFF